METVRIVEFEVDCIGWKGKGIVLNAMPIFLLQESSFRKNTINLRRKEKGKNEFAERF